MEQEILDKNEHYIFSNPLAFENDLIIMKYRHDELHDAPPLCDVNRFPNKEVVKDWVAFNRAYADGLSSRASIEPWRAERLAIVLEETTKLGKIWSTLYEAKIEYYYIGARRAALKRLREQIGVENYYKGILPPHIPTWYFQRID